mmetsp:Transcript_30087/g.30564  ORF Transcript_30087/g.30564 Transcript_30087/m.30564 type:complete len:84 (+) Transcript_30087:260-511(+)
MSQPNDDDDSGRFRRYLSLSTGLLSEGSIVVGRRTIGECDFGVPNCDVKSSVTLLSLLSAVVVGRRTIGEPDRGVPSGDPKLL